MAATGRQPKYNLSRTYTHTGAYPLPLLVSVFKASCLQLKNIIVHKCNKDDATFVAAQ